MSTFHHRLYAFIQTTQFHNNYHPSSIFSSYTAQFLQFARRARLGVHLAPKIGSPLVTWPYTWKKRGKIAACEKGLAASYTWPFWNWVVMPIEREHSSGLCLSDVVFWVSKLMSGYLVYHAGWIYTLATPKTMLTMECREYLVIGNL